MAKLLNSINTLSLLDPTFYDYHTFLKLSELRDGQLKRLDNVEEHPIFHFGVSLLYQSIIHEEDYYIDKSLILKYPFLVEMELQKIRFILTDVSVQYAISQLSTNIKLIKTKYQSNDTFSDIEIILMEKWPQESKIFKLIQIEPHFNKIFPLKSLKTQITKILSKLQRNFNYDVPFDEFIGLCYEKAFEMTKNKNLNSKKRVLAENLYFSNINPDPQHHLYKKIRT